MRRERFELPAPWFVPGQVAQVLGGANLPPIFSQVPLATSFQAVGSLSFLDVPAHECLPAAQRIARGVLLIEAFAYVFLAQVGDFHGDLRDGEPLFYLCPGASARRGACPQRS